MPTPQTIIFITFLSERVAVCSVSRISVSLPRSLRSKALRSCVFTLYMSHCRHCNNLSVVCVASSISRSGRVYVGGVRLYPCMRVYVMCMHVCAW